MKKSFVIDCMLIVGTFVIVSMLITGYTKANAQAIVVESLSSEFTWGDDVQYQVTLSGDEELQLKTATIMEQEATDISYISKTEAIITIRTELLRNKSYEASLSYGDERCNITLR